MILDSALDFLLPQAAPASAAWSWGTVVSTSPLSVRLDGDTEPLASTPIALVPVTQGARVLCQIDGRVYIHGPSADAAAGTSSAPEAVGSIKLWAGDLPSGWLACDGSAVSRTTYADLFAVLGTTFGAGNGTTTFNLPDFRDRVPIGAGSTYAEGATGGSATHAHGLSSSGWASIRLAAAATAQVLMRRISVSSWQATHSLTPSATPAASDTQTSTSGAELGGTTDAGSSLPPYLGVRFIVKASYLAGEVAGTAVPLYAYDEGTQPYTGNSLPSDYPLGTTVFAVGSDATWPQSYGTVETVKVANWRMVQRLTAKQITGDPTHPGFVYRRSGIDATTWSEWVIDGGDTGWVNISFSSGFASYSSFTCRVRRIGSVVYAEGLINRTAGAWAANTVYADVATIPDGFRPSTTGQQFFASATNTGGTDVASIVIDQTGTLGLRTMNEAGLYYSLAGLSWLAA